MMVGFALWSENVIIVIVTIKPVNRMKILSVTLILFGVLLLCSYTTNRLSPVPATSFLKADTTPVEKEKPVIIKLDTAAVAAGLELIAMSDCTTCHKIADKLIGPSYKAIAGKYEITQPNIDLLAKRTITGVSGIWSAVPMTPHPALSMADAQKMMQFIFSCK
jgi:cytochrome c